MKHPLKRPLRAKTHIVWLNIEHHSDVVGKNLEIIAKHYQMLSSQQLRIAALIKSELPSKEICQMLCITEHAVEKHRSDIRKKIGLPPDIKLQAHLVGL